MTDTNGNKNGIETQNRMSFERRRQIADAKQESMIKEERSDWNQLTTPVTQAATLSNFLIKVAFLPSTRL
jgi:hypothetical protein